ncbi:protein-disulfide reductase DsbD [Pelomonas sp. SE-A7]|uniref:protein-disulfide reductase DsbD n=1 Tax=Pelomonas sp. SE-A7 TaxID=3054953 RepID=UPI00259CD770|nr:protein-disulfide reductase DsbD [Pelomonas sp. SE-A7]MDM4766776.1 protein-disulfide reductase DsbD [Pelomonas sp. SE-A7]
MLRLSLQRLVLLSLLILLSLGSFQVRADDDFLEPEQAFKLTVRAVDANTVEVRYQIAPGYYMYREQFRVEAHGATLGKLVMPAGKTKFDETFQKTVEIYRAQLEVQVPVSAAPGPFKLTVTGQGCADKGLCYPPQVTSVDVTLPAAEAAKGKSSPASESVPAATSTESGRLDAALQSGRFWTVVGVFFVAGLLLSLTPCVLPMLPILSSIIVGEGAARASRGRSFLLALSYSLGMALVYTGLGVAAGLAGEGLAAALQQPWVLALFATTLVGFSLSMFGVYELQLPHSMTGGLSSASQKLPAGHFAGVFVMGGVSALIVSPCVAAPLAGALVYLSQSRDVLIGGAALFALACGMSVPLLLLGASAGALLPRAGAWMDGVKHFFGMLLLGVALWTVQPVLPAPLAQALWGALLIASAAMLGLFEHGHAAGRPRTWLRKTVAVVALVYGLLQLLGAAAGGTDPLKPLAGLSVARAESATSGPSGQGGLSFQPVRSVAELDAAIASAARPVMLDFYADWCVSCKEMERYTFSDAQVRQRLAGALLLKADVTANSPADKELLKRFKLFGPPGTVFFDAMGREIREARLIGYQDAQRFQSTLALAGL